MAQRSSAMATAGRVPVECLTGQLAGIWSGWEGLGDREIVRESSAKGTHIELAYKFLERRRHCTSQEAKDYFASEVEIWVSSLVKKKQIHRASHILNNVGKVPAEYIRATCLKCKDPLLRDYLAQHIESFLSDEEKQAWELIKLLAKYEKNLKLPNELISHKCLEEIIKLPQSIKDALYTELYFYNYESSIVVHLKSDVVWNYLLTNNRIELIKLWIDLAFGQSDGVVCNEEEQPSNIQTMFKNWKITDEMINSIESSNGMPLVNNLILNYLCRYGIFTAKECSDNKLILSRLLGECIAKSDFQKILSNPLCNVDKEKFFAKLDVIEFSRNYVEDSESQKIDIKNKKLYDCLNEMCRATNNYKDFLELGIIETINYLSDDPVQYLNQNPIILFTLIFLHYSKCKEQSNELTLKDILHNSEGLKINTLTLPKETLDTVILELPYLKSEIDRKRPKNDITMYQLLDGYKNFNSTTFFKWRLNNGAMPNFQSENLVRKFGRKEKLSYINYLKEARPNMAAYIFRQHQKKLSGAVSSKSKSQAALCAHIFALRHSKTLEVVSGCVSFLEILGINSDNLRLHITIAQLVQKELNISIENLLESIIYNNQQNLKLVMNYLERSFQSYLNIKTINDDNEFIQSLRTWELIVRFAKAHNTLLPTSLLKFLAFNDAWFEFVLVAQIFAYPSYQVMDCAKNFADTSLREHLLLALSNRQLLHMNKSNFDPQLRGGKIREKDFQMLHSDIITSPQPSPPQFSISSIKRGSIATSPIRENSLPMDDLWLVILKCHHSPDPPGALLSASHTFKSPILTILATCYEPSSMSSYCYTWLVISVENAEFATNYEECLESQLWTASTVSDLFHNMVSHGFVSTLCRGLQIFLPENPLKLFFQFLEQCLEYGNFDDCHYLNDFLTACSNYKCNKLIHWECNDATYLENVYWIQTVVVKYIIVALSSASQSTHAQMKLLSTLIKCEYQKKLIVDTPNFESLLEYTKILCETNVSLNYYCFDMTKKIREFEAEIERCVNELIDQEDYSNALKLSKVANLKPSKIILAQYRSEFKRLVNKTGTFDTRFWSRCSADFKKYEVCYEKAAEFFVEHAEKVKSYQERYAILKLALEILEANSQDRHMCDTVEMAMWKSAILAGPDNIEIEAQTGVFTKLKTELLSSVSELQVNCSLTEPEEKVAVEVLIKRLLDANRLKMALRISAIFNCRSRELQVLMLCLSLAEGEISPYQLTVQQRTLVTKPNRQPRQRNSTLRSLGGLPRLPSSSSLNLSSANGNLSNVSEAANATLIAEQQEQLDCLSLLTNLVETLNHGVDIGIRILLCYRLAVQLGKRYHVLLTLSNPMQFLQEIVSGPYDRRLEIARDIITAYQIENQSIANFLAEEIVAHITQIIEDGLNEPTAAWNYNMNLQSVIELCKDTSLLGLRLLDIAHKLLGNSNGEKRNLVTLKIIVELLIRSHDCFTAACNMEGIESVLRKCQQLANSLQNLKHWSILVRLVTGVGRFTEMNYVFQILKEHDQFEFLLGRGLDKVPGLRMALLDFLKRNCPENKDLFNIVALHFRLYFEIALIWEKEANEIITDLISEAKKECGKNVYNTPTEIKFIRNEATEKKLQMAITNFTHATQYFLQDNKLKNANRCSHQAQLVALQISLLNNVQPNHHFPSVLNLTSDEINKAISRFLNFTQALIIARAYEHYVDWASAIYNHCLVNGETKYLRDFVTSKRLTASIAIDCARKYRLEKNITLSMAENMRAIVAKLNDIECKYVLASQLGFRSIVEEMLDEPATSVYLKDTVFKRGFVAAEFIG